MALECRKTAAAGLVVSNISKIPYNENDQRLPLSTMNREENQENCSESSHKKAQIDIDKREVYFLIMHFLSDGPCRKTCAQLKEELEEYKLLPRRYHAWYSRGGIHSGDNEDDGISVPLSYSELLERFSFIERNHLVRLLEELVSRSSETGPNSDAKNPTAADASTLLGTGSVSLLKNSYVAKNAHGFWNRAGQVYGLLSREIGGGLARHHRAPSVRGASYHIVRPSVLAKRIQMIKTLRGHRNAVYCAIFDKSGEYIITGSDDRLVKIWSTTTGFCLSSCRGHDGDITDLAVSVNNLLLASASNDYFIRVWRFPDGLPVSVLKGHTRAVTAIAFSPRHGCEHHLLSTSDDGTCRIWDARDSSINARIYAPKLEAQETGNCSGVKASDLGPESGQPKTQILCCAFNASGTVFVTGSADKLARVWDACKWSDEMNGAPNHEIDTLRGHEDDVNYVQFSGCAAPSRCVNVDLRLGNASLPIKSDRFSRFRNSWFGYESIVSCSRDGSAIIWVPRPRKYHGKSRWMKGYHLRVPPPPTPPQPPRGVPRQRLLPTPRGVNMIVWSLDNRYVLAAIMDCRICVWNAVDGSLVHSLTGHTKSTFVLDVHPYDPRIAMSAGYDGRVIVWDIWEGCSIHVYQMGDFHLVDGKFSPDGTSIVISDEVGQIYLLATGEGRSQKDAKYDQFFLGDYRPLIRDIHGNVLDQETQLSPYQRNVQDLLCDANMVPYAEPYQTMFQQRRLGAIGISWTPPPPQWITQSFDDSNYFPYEFPLLLPPDEDESVAEAQQAGTRWVEQPIDDDAMEWEQDSVDDAGSDYTFSFDNGCDDDDDDDDERECSLTASEDLDGLEEDESSDEDDQNHRASLRRSERNKKKEEEDGQTSMRTHKRKLNSSSREYSLRSSKRHRKSRISRSARREVDGEVLPRRPKRLAAKNARKIFSRISAEEEQSDSYKAEKLDSDEEEQFSAREDVDKEDFENNELEMTREGLLIEAGPSTINMIRITRSHRTENVRIPSRRSFKREIVPAVDGDSLGVEEQETHTSLSGEKKLDDLETFDDSRNSSQQLDNRDENFCNVQEGLEVENCSPVDDGLIDRHIKREEITNVDYYNGENKQISFHAANLNQGGSESETAYCDNPSNLYEINFQHGNALCRNTRDSEQENDVDDPERKTNLRTTVISKERLVEGITSYQSQEDGEQDSDSVELPTKANSFAILEQDQTPQRHDVFNNSYVVHAEHLKNDPSTSKNARESDDEQVYCTEDIDDELVNHNKGSEEEAYLKSSVASLYSEGQSKVTANSRRLQLTETSWKHNSRTCLWLRQCRKYSENKEDSSSEDRDSDGDNVDDIPRQRTRGNQECHLKLTFKRGKRRTMKPRMYPDKNIVTDYKNNVSQEHVVREENGVEDNELSGLMPVTLTYTRTRRNVDEDEGKSTNECQDSDIRVEKRVGLRCSMNLRNSINHAESSRIMEDAACKGKRGSRNRVSWLMLTKVEDGTRYIPQLGDEVAYVLQGHEDFCEKNKFEDKGFPKHLQSRLRAVEMCRVTDIEYGTISAFSGVICKLTLMLLRQDCKAFGKTIKLMLPELTDYPDFIIERSRYEASLERNWTKRDKCQVWWRTDTINEYGEETTGEWYIGRVVKVEAISPEYPRSPWEACLVRYKVDSSYHRHSPWELFDVDVDVVKPSYSCIDEEIKSRILSIIEKVQVSSQDEDVICGLKKLLHKPDFLNKTLVPISLDTIKDRLHNDYYRTLDSLHFDIQLLATNVENYLHDKNGLAIRVKQLTDQLLEET